MNESLAFEFVALRSVSVQAVGNILEERLEIAKICHELLLLAKVVAVVAQVVVAVVVEKVGIYLFSYNLVGNNKFCIAHICSAQCHHAEVEQKADEIVVVGNALCREARF